MITRKYSQRPLLQRRKSLVTTFQAMADGLIVLFTAYLFFLNTQGFVTTLDAALIIILLAILGVTYDHMGIYRQFGGVLKSSKKLFIAWSMSFAITLFIFIMAQYFDQLSQPALVAIYPVAFAGQFVNRWLLIKFQSKTSRTRNDDHVLLIGDGSLVKHLYDNINSNPWINEKAIGRIGISNKIDDISVPILGGKDDILRIVSDNQVKSIYIAVSLEDSHLIKGIYLESVSANVDIHWLPNLSSLDLINPSVKEMAGIPLLTLSESPLIGNHRLFKAIEDRVLAFIFLFLLSPLFIVFAVLIKLDSSGPIFFRQNRTGWNGNVFHIWKFRSMEVHQEAKGEVKQASIGDGRITAVGRFVRKTSIDELPQLFNVLSGKMSLVGPRPHAIEHNADYAERIDAYLTRHRIKPGITGLAQVHGYRGETDTLDKMEKRVEYDLQYINNWSFWLDIEILLKTLPAMLKGGAY